MTKKYTTDEYIAKAKVVHGEKYNYSLVDYCGSHGKIKIICPEHGIFEQSGYKHLKGDKCPKCRGYYKTTDDFINQANLIHNNKYKYNKTKYINSHKKVKIICSKHGLFEQEPSNHLNGQGCPKCIGNNKTNMDFISEAKKIHGDKYDYSLVEYVGNKLKVDIICPIHGIFKQKPNNHLNGQGCKQCNESKGEIIISNYLNENNIEFVREKKFDNCKNIRKLPFDFYLPEKNILIEYDGIQHFKPIVDFISVDEFNKIKLNDNIKNNFADSNNIKLIRIKYSEMNEISNILNEVI